MAQQVMRKIKLYGKLRQFGKEFNLAVSSPAEAIKALCVQLPGFEKFLMQAKDNGMEFAVFNGKQNINESELNFSGTKEIRIAPILTGSKRNGLFQTILGVVLVVIGVVFPPASGLIAPGIALIAGGVIQLLSPQPKGLKSREATENAASYAFGSSVNTTAQGNPVGILAGERIIGGAIISAGIYAENLT